MTEITKTNVQGLPFDLVLRFDGNIEHPRLFMDELVKLTLEGLIERYGSIAVKINWWDSNLTVLAVNDVPSNDKSWSIDHNDIHALQGTQEARTGTIASDSTSDT